jgi:secreted trypsin-like serine protease
MIFVFLVAFLLCPTVDGTRPLIPDNIGNPANAHDYPWLLNVINNTIKPVTRKNHFCGAALLRVKDGIENSDMVLTAAHCIMQKICVERDMFGCTKQKYILKYTNKEELAIIAGNHHLDTNDKGEQTLAIAKMLYYNEGKLSDDDIAIIKLSSPIHFTETIQPIDISEKGEMTKDGRNCTIAGWGDVIGGTTPNKLQHLNVTIRSEKTCKEKLARIIGLNYDHRRYLCAGSTSEDMTGVCGGDSGSPLVCKSNNKWTAYGVVSSGEKTKCGDGTKPAVYTRISAYTDWIEKQIRTMSSLWPKNAKTRHVL